MYVSFTYSMRLDVCVCVVFMGVECEFVCVCACVAFTLLESMSVYVSFRGVVGSVV